MSFRIKKVSTFPLTVKVSYPQEGGFVDGKFKATARWYPREEFEKLLERIREGELSKTEALEAMIVKDSWELLHDETGERFTAEEIVADIYLEAAIGQAYANAHIDALGKTLRRSR